MFFAKRYAPAATKSSIHAKYEVSISSGSMIMDFNIDNRQTDRETGQKYARSTDAGA